MKTYLALEELKVGHRYLFDDREVPVSTLVMPDVWELTLISHEYDKYTFHLDRKVISSNTPSFNMEEGKRFTVSLNGRDPAPTYILSYLSKLDERPKKLRNEIRGLLYNE